MESARQGEVLDERAALRLARVADYVQQAFGGPRDIEFAMAQVTERERDLRLCICVFVFVCELNENVCMCVS